MDEKEFCPDCKHEWRRHTGRHCSARTVDASGNYDICDCVKKPKMDEKEITSKEKVLAVHSDVRKRAESAESALSQAQTKVEELTAQVAKLLAAMEGTMEELDVSE